MLFVAHVGKGRWMRESTPVAGLGLVETYEVRSQQLHRLGMMPAAGGSGVELRIGAAYTEAPQQAAGAFSIQTTQHEYAGTGTPFQSRHGESSREQQHA